MAPRAWERNASQEHSSPAVLPAPGMESKGESQLQLAPSPLHVLEDRDHPPGCVCLAGEGTEPVGRYRCRAPHPRSAPSTLSAPAGALQGSPSSVLLLLAGSPHPERHPVSHTGVCGGQTVAQRGTGWPGALQVVWSKALAKHGHLELPAQGLSWLLEIPKETHQGSKASSLTSDTTEVRNELVPPAISTMSFHRPSDLLSVHLPGLAGTGKSTPTSLPLLSQTLSAAVPGLSLANCVCCSPPRQGLQAEPSLRPQFDVTVARRCSGHASSPALRNKSDPKS